MTPNPAGAVAAPITRLFAFGYKSRRAVFAQLLYMSVTTSAMFCGWHTLARGTQPGGRAIDANQEPAGGERGPKPEDFQILSSAIILDRNSRICFHKCMETGALPKTNRARCRARTVSLITCST